MLVNPRGMAVVLHDTADDPFVRQNKRLDLLMIRLSSGQPFALDVQRVREVMPCPPVRRVPKAHWLIRGVVSVRGRTVPVVDLGQAMGADAVDGTDGYLVLAEIGAGLCGLLVGGLDRINSVDQEQLRVPDGAAEAAGYLCGVFEVQGALVQVLDPERLLAGRLGPDWIEAAVAQSAAGDGAGAE